MIVADASAIVELLFGTAHAGRVGERILQPTETLHAAPLLVVELAQVLRRCRS